jgi:hypothetical protein
MELTLRFPGQQLQESIPLHNSLKIISEIKKRKFEPEEQTASSSLKNVDTSFTRK